eukprot:1284310-Pyramimonas_sp.AAC.1
MGYFREGRLQQHRLRKVRVRHSPGHFRERHWQSADIMPIKHGVDPCRLTYREACARELPVRSSQTFFGLSIFEVRGKQVDTISCKLTVAKETVVTVSVSNDALQIKRGNVWASLDDLTKRPE